MSAGGARQGLIQCQIDETRLKSFYSSLNKTLLKVAEDPVVRQLLKNKTSCQFISKRIEEIINKVLTDDRERYITKLIEKYRPLEKFTTDDPVLEMQQIGKNILSVSDKHNTTEVNDKRKIHYLETQIKDLQEELVSLRVKKSIQILKSDEIVSNVLKSNPSDKRFLDFIKEVNVTELGVKLQKIRTELLESRELLVAFGGIVQETCNEMKDKSQKSLQLLQDKIHNINKQLMEEREAKNDLQKHYVEEIIPQFLNRQNESKKRRKEADERRLQEINELKSLLMKFHSDLKVSNRQKDNLIMENRSLTESNNESKDLIKKLRSTQNANIDKIEELRLNLREVKMELSDSQSNVESQKLLISRLKNENLNLNRSLGELISKNEETERLLSLAREDSSNAEVKLRQHIRKLEESQTEISSLQSTISNFEAIKANLEQQAADLSAKNAAVSRELRQSNKIIDREKAESSRKDGVIANYMKENDTLKRKIIDLENEQRKLRQQVEATEEVFEDKYADLISELEGKKLRAEQDLERLQAFLQREKDNHEKTRQNLEAVNDEKERVDDEVKKLSFSQRQNEEKIRNLQNLLDQRTTELDDASMSAKQLEQQIAVHNEEKESLRKQNRKLVSEMNENQAKSSIELEKVRNSLRDKENSNKQLSNKLKETQQKLSEVKSDSEKSKQKLNDAQQQNSDMSRSIAQLKGTCEDYSRQLKRIENELGTSDQLEIEEQLKRLKKASAFKDQLMSILRAKNADEAIRKAQATIEKVTTFDHLLGLMGAPNAGELERAVSRMLQENKYLNDEKKRIMSLLSEDPHANPAEIMAGILKKQKELDKELAEAGEFISDIVSTLTGGEHGDATIVFPMADSDRRLLLSTVAKRSQTATADREQVNRLVLLAKELNYEGDPDDAVSAAEYVTQYRLREQRISFEERKR